MNTAAAHGIALIMVGVMAFAYQGLTDATPAQVISFDLLHTLLGTHETNTLPLLVGGLALVGGIALLVVAVRRRMSRRRSIRIIGSVSMHRVL